MSSAHAQAQQQAGANVDRDILVAELLEWFDLFAGCVRRRDIQAAEQLFDPQVVAFGTRNEMMIGRDSLRDLQWRPTWDATKGFQFLNETIHLDFALGGENAWGCCLWTSRAEPGDQPGFDRRGRATFGFARSDAWRCTHSHLSLTPSGSL